MNKIVKIIIFLVLLFVLMIVCCLIWYSNSLKGIKESQKIEIVVDEKSTFSNLGRTLEEKKLIKSELAYKIPIIIVI